MALVTYDPHLRDNKGASRLAGAAKRLGFQGKVKDRATFADIRTYVLKKKIPVIVNWFSVNEGHYSVVVDIDGTHITLRDPETGRARRMPLNEFEAVWFDFSPHDVRTPKSLVAQRMIVIANLGI